MHHWLQPYVSASLLDRDGQGEADLTLDVADRTEREAHAKKVREQLLCHSLAQAVSAGADSDHRLQARPEGRPRLRR